MKEIVSAEEVSLTSVEYTSLHIDEDWYLIQTVLINNEAYEHRKYWLPEWLWTIWLMRVDD